MCKTRCCKYYTYHVYIEPANPHDESAVTVIDGGPHSEVIYRSHGILLHEGLSFVSHITGRRRKGKA